MMRRSVALLAGLVLALSASLLRAQGGEGQIAGVVKDVHGGLLAAATVTATGPVSRAERTGPHGQYRIGGLPPGTYTVTATLPGFAEARREGVEIGAIAAVDLSLTLTPAVREEVVVSAGRNVESTLIDAPATVSVVTADTIAASSAHNFGDMLRTVAGLNVVQSSARDFNLAARQASPLLTNSQLALLDGRTIYADFFNIVFWDLVPTNAADVKQIEVVRGPASAMWGANATTGVVNIITKTPREAPGGTVALTGGGFRRDVEGASGQGAGGVFGIDASWAQAPNDRWSYRLSSGYFRSDALARPHGNVPLARSPLDPTVAVGGGSFDDLAYKNQGTAQPRFDLRVDRELSGGGKVSGSAGIAGSEGIIHSQIGPFDLDSGSRFGYGRLAYTKGGVRVSAFANLLRGDASNLVTRAATGDALRIDFKTETYDLDAGWTGLVANRHVLNVGANLRRNVFDISIAPSARNRTEIGAYVQDEVQLGRLFRLAASARLDKFTSLADPFFSPRVALIFKPTPEHSLKVAVNRAFRAPSAIDNHLDIDIIGGVLPLDLFDPSLAPFPIVTRTVGNESLEPESLMACEVGYQGTLGNRTSLGVSLYLNDTDSVISSAQAAQSEALLGYDPYYSSENPPPGWPLPPETIDLLAAQGIHLPAIIKTVNLGRLRNEGLEAWVQHAVKPWLTAYANYSYQALPEIRTPASDPRHIPEVSVSVPPKNRFNLGLNLTHPRWLGSLSVSQVDKAFFTDVLEERYYGYAEAYTLVNASLGIRFAQRKVTASLKATNLLDHEIQQHNFGDVLTRTVVGELRLAF